MIFIVGCAMVSISLLYGKESANPNAAFLFIAGITIVASSVFSAIIRLVI